MVHGKNGLVIFLVLELRQRTKVTFTWSALIVGYVIVTWVCVSAMMVTRDMPVVSSSVLVPATVVHRKRIHSR